MGLDAVLGQGGAVTTLELALRSGRRHHAYRFEGPAGVGKELAAFRFAQALVCEAPTPYACEKCSSCMRALTWSKEDPLVPLHPDVILVGKGVYPASVLGKAELTGIGVEQIRRVVLARTGYAPHEGRHLVFVVRDADLLTTQAANALLKTLEEPDPRTQFLLLTSRPQRLLDTIRSRTLPVRFAALTDTVLEEILRRQGLSTEWISLAQGSAEQALLLATEDAAQAQEAFLTQARSALSAPSVGKALELAASAPKDRDAARQLLQSLAQQFAQSARRFAFGESNGSARASTRYQVVLSALSALEQNAQTQLVFEKMLLSLRNA